MKKIGCVKILFAGLVYFVVTLCCGFVFFYMKKVEFLAEKLQGLFTTNNVSGAKKRYQ